ncbi:FecCD family ABC transporter permease [Aeromicrobium sp. CTD01-1L150]|uniref:FecCD family ABC transporter permease n=1 Tax=Aeromicrobium sp. CTD01-1L150 TaxID=3341830 RepID=UPI0035BFFC66
MFRSRLFSGTQGQHGSALAWSVVMATCILGLLLVSASVGAVEVRGSQAARIMVGHLLPGMPWMSDGSLTPLQDQAVWQFRLPRALLAGVAGASLSLAGMLMQAIVRNPLAEPYILGVSSGASVGAVLVIISGAATFYGLTLSAAAFVGAVSTCVAVALLAQRHGVLSPTRLVLSGVALGTFLSAVTSYLTITTDAQNVVGVLFFILGSVSGADMAGLILPALALALALLIVLPSLDALNAMLTGDESAAALGINASAVRTRMMVVAALLTAAVVSVAGGIAFVGLVAPHVARILVGVDHRRVLPVATLTGAAFLMGADLLARTVAPPTEVPLGVLTAFVGAPLFLWLMRRDAAASAGFDR